VNQGFNFASKTILVTGGSSGIGRATAILFARHGAKVVIGDIDLAGGRTVEAIEGEKGGRTRLPTRPVRHRCEETQRMGSEGLKH
jgi:NAD(P)-dependent dehydrogenase (short-subunit alcohol dehydrogenase family)